MNVYNKHQLGWLQKLNPICRLTLSVLTGIIIFVLLRMDLPLVFKLLVSWVGFCLIYLISCWLVIAKMPISAIKARANAEDGSTIYVFALILLAAFASLFAVLILVMNRHNFSEHLLVPLAVCSMLLSWFMIHTIFSFHYAHQYYAEDGKKEGLIFPGDKNVAYMDFVYFSFGVGCTFQVADVSISSRTIRCTVFFHSLLSFLLNTFVVALTINIIAGLIQ